VSLDLELLGAQGSYRDADTGVRETFVHPILGEGRGVGVLSTPATDGSRIGWVLCQPYGIEQVHLGRLDVLLARAAADAGMPALRYQGAGYGDAELGMELTGPTSHLAEAKDAVGFLRDETGVEQVGVIGSRFGATVAALVADRLELAAMVLVGPLVSGKAYLATLLRSMAVKRAVTGRNGGAGEDPRAMLERQGSVDVQGFPLSLVAARELEAIDLVEQVERFRGSALILSPAREDRVPRPSASLADRLSSLGADVTSEAVTDPFGPQFGSYRWRTIEGGRSKRDAQLELDEEIVRRVGTWIVDPARPWRAA
jgi:pimeloyl-ACP methyl ester carboxylesterase